MRDLARDAAATAGVRHQHAIAAGEREIGRQRRAFVAALFLHHLHQHDLAAADDFLDLVAARQDAAAALVERVVVFLVVLGFGFRCREFGLDRFLIGVRDRVIVGVDFGEGEEAVAVAAVLNEGGLQRRLNARHLGQIDIASELFAVLRLEIEIFNAFSVEHRDPGFFRDGRRRSALSWPLNVGSVGVAGPRPESGTQGRRGDAK